MHRINSSDTCKNNCLIYQRRISSNNPPKRILKDAFVQKTPKKFKSSGLQCRNWVSSPERLQRNSKSLKDKGVQVQKPPLYIELIQHCDKTVRNYTGIDSYKLFKILHKY